MCAVYTAPIETHLFKTDHDNVSKDAVACRYIPKIVAHFSALVGAEPYELEVEHDFIATSELIDRLIEDYTFNSVLILD